MRYSLIAHFPGEEPDTTESSLDELTEGLGSILYSAGAHGCKITGSLSITKPSGEELTITLESINTEATV